MDIRHRIVLLHHTQKRRPLLTIFLVELDLLGPVLLLFTNALFGHAVVSLQFLILSFGLLLQLSLIHTITVD